MLKRSGFKKQSLEEIKEKQAIKREKLLILKKSIKAPVKAVLGRSQGIKKVIKKPKEKSMKSIHDKVWKLCREIIINLYKNTCYTTGVKNLEGSNLHLSHLIAKAALPMCHKYDLRLLRPASYHSNINLSGDTHNYLNHYLEECNITHAEWELFRKQIKTAPLIKARDYLQEKIIYLEEAKHFCERMAWNDECKNAYTRYVPN